MTSHESRVQQALAAPCLRNAQAQGRRVWRRIFLWQPACQDGALAQQGVNLAGHPGRKLRDAALGDRDLLAVRTGQHQQLQRPEHLRFLAENDVGNPVLCNRESGHDGDAACIDPFQLGCNVVESPPGRRCRVLRASPAGCRPCPKSGRARRVSSSRQSSSQKRRETRLPQRSGCRAQRRVLQAPGQRHPAARRAAMKYPVDGQQTIHLESLTLLN